MSLLEEEFIVNPQDNIKKSMFHIKEKLKEIETINIDDNESRVMEVHLDDRIVNMYKQIGEVLSKYRSGKLPKAFKILPTLTNWEHV